MRNILDAILSAIGASTLSDLEFSSLEIESAAYDLATYDALLAVVDARELVSNTRDRLGDYFVAHGVDVPESSQGTTNVFVGADISGC